MLSAALALPVQRCFYTPRPSPGWPARGQWPRPLKASLVFIKPAIAQLVEHLTVELRSYQMVPGSIPGGRTFTEALAVTAIVSKRVDVLPQSLAVKHRPAVFSHPSGAVPLSADRRRNLSSPR